MNGYEYNIVEIPQNSFDIEFDLKNFDIKGLVSADIYIKFTVKPIILPELPKHELRNPMSNPFLRQLYPLFKNGVFEAIEEIKRIVAITGILQSYDPLDILWIRFSNSYPEIQELSSMGDYLNDYPLIQSAIGRLEDTPKINKLQDEITARIAMYGLVLLPSSITINSDFDDNSAEHKNNLYNDYIAINQIISEQKKTKLMEAEVLEKDRRNKNSLTDLQNLNKFEQDKEEERIKNEERHNEFLLKEFEIKKQRLPLKLISSVEDFNYSKELELSQIQIEKELIEARENLYSLIGKDYLSIEDFKLIKSKQKEVEEKEIEAILFEFDKKIRENQEELNLLPAKIEHSMRQEMMLVSSMLDIVQKSSQQELLLSYTKFDNDQREELVKLLGEQTAKVLNSISSENQQLKLYSFSTNGLFGEVLDYFKKIATTNPLIHNALDSVISSMSKLTDDNISTPSQSGVLQRTDSTYEP